MLLIILPVLGFAQSTGTIKGNLKLKDWKYNPNSKILIKEVNSQNIVQVLKVDENGEFTSHDIPFASYIIEYYEADNLMSQGKITISSNLPVSITLHPLSAYTTHEVEVLADPSEKNITGGRTFYTSQAIESMPVIAGNRAIESVILNSPGTVPDEDGRLHVRGEDAQLQYIIDGIPVTMNQTRIYSSLFNAGIIKSLVFNRGGMNAEYGVAASGIMNITTKSGFDRPYFAHAYGQFGSFSSNDQGFEAGGNIGQKASLFVGYSSGYSQRYLDPIALGDPIHDAGKTSSYFIKADALLTDKIDMVVLGSYGKTNFDIPNANDSIPSKQDQKQSLTNMLLGLRINAVICENTILSLVGYTKEDKAEITSNGLNQLTSFSDYTIALNNDKYFMGGNRDDKAFGGMLELSTHIFDKDNFKAGFGGETFPLQEYLSFAVTNPRISDSTISGGDSRYKPYDITQGGRPFYVNSTLDGNRLYGYIQDEIAYKNWNFLGGLRYDMYHLFNVENNISLRLGATYEYSNNLVLRASYNRIVMQPPLENIIVSSSLQADTLVGANQTVNGQKVDTHVKSEKAHVLEIGGTYQLNKYVTFDLAGYGKLINDFIVKVELGNSGIIFPANLRDGYVVGGELQIFLNNWNNFSGFLNFTTCMSLGVKPSDANLSPVSGGLILGEEGQNYSHPFGGESSFPTEHNQLLTANFNLSYNFLEGLFVTLGGHFDSGLPFDLVDSTGNGIDDQAKARAELKKRGYSDQVIDLLDLSPGDKPNSPDKSVAPHITFDLSAGIDLRKFSSIPIRITGTIINIFNTEYLYKFESSFGGTHFGTPRMFNLRADVYTF